LSRAAFGRNFQPNAASPNDFGRYCSGNQPPCRGKPAVLNRKSTAEWDFVAAGAISPRQAPIGAIVSAEASGSTAAGTHSWTAGAAHSDFHPPIKRSFHQNFPGVKIPLPESPEAPLPLIGYARVSTEDQNLGPQLDVLRAAGCQEVFEEFASGANRARPLLAAALTRVRRGGTLVVACIDRLARSLSQRMPRTHTTLHAPLRFSGPMPHFSRATA
jgi:hypothetical protein